MHEPYAISVPPTHIMGQLWTLQEGWRLFMDVGLGAELVVRVRPDLWFQRFEVPRPVNHLRETLMDVGGIAKGLQLAQERDRYPRSYHILLCPQFCSYSELCLAEYQLGKHSPEHRDAGFIIDTGEREGR